MSASIRLVVLLSGSGTTLQNILDQCADGRLPGRVVLVISNNHDAYGLVRAQHEGIPVAVVDRRGCVDRLEFSDRVFARCREAAAELVCLAGFLQLLPVPDDYQHRVLNIHPALIPAFCGKGYYGHHVHQAVLDYGAKISGCTVHFCDNEYDHGPIVLQRAVAVQEGDTAEALAERVFEQECIAYPEAIRLFAAGRLQVDGRCVRIRSAR